MDGNQKVMVNAHAQNVARPTPDRSRKSSARGWVTRHIQNGSNIPFDFEMPNGSYKFVSTMIHLLPVSLSRKESGTLFWGIDREENVL